MPTSTAKMRPLTRDTGTGRIGEVMDRRDTNRGPRVWLRPVGGGTEWEVPAGQVVYLDRDGNPAGTPETP